MRQPYADEIVGGEKRVEYRSIKTKIRGWVYVYAGQKANSVKGEECPWV